MATALASEIDEIWPPDMGKSSPVEERSLTAHRISEDNLVSESDARDISNKTSHGGNISWLEIWNSALIEAHAPIKKNRVLGLPRIPANSVIRTFKDRKQRQSQRNRRSQPSSSRSWWWPELGWSAVGMVISQKVRSMAKKWFFSNHFDLQSTEIVQGKCGSNFTPMNHNGYNDVFSKL
ncbi:uncharacterized protein LOC110891612 isoform X2 [Helianthus annuus]|uniref:uncharacterized protein LOC110891612 isoform X2 n=1 Tax=Helianthus annuus TaxID=4232 RepID=UPI000B8F90BF|nr:uncharacterized protein LOC110891612 isoform X2 [Helianthus annuus]